MTSPIHRRNLIKSGMAAGLTGLSGTLDCTVLAKEPAQPIVAPDRGFSQINLLTSKLDELYRFYEKDLNLESKKLGKELLVKAGKTQIVFESVDSKFGDPFYHFAFNIPENKISKALAWQKKRTKLVRRGKNEVIHFSNWNAHSVFFNDPAGNIVEYIARHDLKNQTDGDFSSDDILYASEVGLVVKDVPQTVKEIRKQLKLDIYKGSFNFFAPMGDEHALLILVRMNRKWTPDKVREAKPFPVTAAIRAMEQRTFEVVESKFKIETHGPN